MKRQTYRKTNTLIKYCGTFCSLNSKKQNAAVFLGDNPGDGKFAVLDAPHCRAFAQLNCPTPGNLPFKKKKIQMSRGGGGGANGHGNGID